MSSFSINAHTDYEKKISTQDPRIHNLGSLNRVWVIGSVRGKVNLLEKIFNKIINKMLPLDRLVFTGNLVGNNLEENNYSARTIDLTLQFRAQFLSNKCSDVMDVVFLRGYFEEILEKSIELHMSLNPMELVYWMYSRGLDQILKSYDISSDLLHNAARSGAAALSRASVEIRDAINNNPGHSDYLASLKRLAFNKERTLLFVSAGLSKDRPIETQGDELWWGGGFVNLDDPYFDMLRIIRGYDPNNRGLASGKYGITLDGGDEGICAALFQSDGKLLETIQA